MRQPVHQVNPEATPQVSFEAIPGVRAGVSLDNKYNLPELPSPM